MYRRYFLELGVVGKVLDGHADGSISQHILGTSQNSGELVGSVESLDETSHTSAGDGTASKDVHGVIAHGLGHTSGVVLEQRALGSELLSLLVGIHLGHLKGHHLVSSGHGLH